MSATKLKAVKQCFRRVDPLDEWHVGAMALCLTDAWYPDCPADPGEADIHRVKSVLPIRGVHSGRITVFLILEGKPEAIAWSSHGFRIAKSHEHEVMAGSAWLQQLLGKVPAIAGARPRTPGDATHA